jgi:LmbE family N-acetylglucosaminyl deacetylase
MAKVIVVAAHPDDETLGAGGALLKHKANGDQVYWVITTNIFEKQGFSAERIKKRQSEIDEVARHYGFDGVYKLDYPTMTLSGSSLFTLIPKVSEVFNEVEPEIIYIVNRSDAHSDHRITFDAIMACTKSFRYPYIKKVLMYECISETEFAPVMADRIFQPTYYIDISGFFEKKLEIMKIYASELGTHPFPRSLRNIEALATFRGATAGVQYAEAFQVIKIIDK